MRETCGNRSWWSIRWGCHINYAMIRTQEFSSILGEGVCLLTEVLNLIFSLNFKATFQGMFLHLYYFFFSSIHLILCSGSQEGEKKRSFEVWSSKLISRQVLQLDPLDLLGREFCFSTLERTITTPHDECMKSMWGFWYVNIHPRWGAKHVGMRLWRSGEH